MRRKLTDVVAGSSSLFTAFAISFVTLIVVTTFTLISNFSMQPHRDFSGVKIEIKRVIPHLPLSSEREGERSDLLKQQTQVNEKLQVIEVFSGDNLSDKFQKRVNEFVGDGCEVNFVMTWISPADFFGNREVLAIESVFKSHPYGCLMILSATMDSPQGYATLKPFIDRGYKVLAVTPDLPFLLKGTAGELWLDEIKSGKRDPGKISLAQNLSNLMRLAYLYKYGGVYLDTDMIVLKSFKGLRNVIGAQTLDPSSTNWTRLNELMASAKIVAEAAQAAARHESDKLDKAKVAGATADILDAASRYGKLDEKSGVGQYLEKAEQYLHKYETSHSHSSTGGTGSHGNVGGHGGGAGAPAAKKEDEKSGGGHGFGDYAKMAQGFMK